MQKARFTEQQLPVKIIQKDGTAYVYICQNETQGQETYPDMGEGQTVETYYEYDYNEIIGLSEELPLDDIREHPGNYINYVHKETKANEDIETRVSNIEKLLYKEV